MDAAKSCTATFVERVMVSASVTGATGSVAASSSDTAASCSGACCTIDKGGSVDADRAQPGRLALHQLERHRLQRAATRCCSSRR
jgi:hypothetical protein